MRNLITAIARLLGLSTKPTEATRVLQTQTVGPVLLGRTQQTGSKLSVQTTSPHKSSPALTKHKPKSEPAQQTTPAAKLGKKRPTARQVAMVSQSKPTGSKSKIVASPLSQQKPKRSAAQSTKADQSLNKEPSLQGKQGRGKQSATPASKTRQPVQPASTKKPKAAGSTLAAKKGTQGKTPVRTRMVRQSKASGS